jgi:hypothetical protein
MPKKPKTRTRVVRPRSQPVQRPTPAARWRLKLLLGGAILVVALGIGAVVRYRQPANLSPQAQGAVDKHYTRGTAGAPVVIKEFSDYT